MRTYTSLAGHILGPHPQINGYYEMHLSYEDASARGHAAGGVPAGRWARTLQFHW